MIIYENSKGEYFTDIESSGFEYKTNRTEYMKLKDPETLTNSEIDSLIVNLKSYISKRISKLNSLKSI